VKGTPSQKVIVTGSTGLLGRSLVKVLKDRHDVVRMSRQAAGGHNEIAVDIVQEHETVESIVKVGPHVVVHAAAQTNVDQCETERALARRINVEGTANVAEGCARARARLIFISTDYVFDGTRGNYGEDDQPNPINFYGLTKLEAERIVATASSSFLIVRTGVLYGWHPSRLNFATWTLNGLSEHQQLRVAKDHINSPTFADNLAEAIGIAIERRIEGLLHVAGSQRISRFDFALKIAKRFNLDEGLLVPVEMQDLKWIARRPRDSSLRVGKAEKELGIALFGVDRGLQEMVGSRQ